MEVLGVFVWLLFVCLSLSPPHLLSPQREMWLVAKNGTSHAFLFLIGVTFFEVVVDGAIYKDGGDSIEKRKSLRECGIWQGADGHTAGGEGFLEVRLHRTVFAATQKVTVWEESTESPRRLRGQGKNCI